MTTIIDYRICPSVRVHRATQVNVNNATLTPIVWDAVDFDPWQMWAGGAGTANLMAVVPGIYRISAAVWFDGFAVGQRYVIITKNGVEQARASYYVSTAGVVANVAVGDQLSLANGDLVAISVYQDRGGVLGILSGTNLSAGRLTQIGQS